MKVSCAVWVAATEDKGNRYRYKIRLTASKYCKNKTYPLNNRLIVFTSHFRLPQLAVRKEEKDFCPLLTLIVSLNVICFAESGLPSVWHNELISP